MATLIPNQEFIHRASEEQITKTVQALETHGIRTLVVETDEAPSEEQQHLWARYPAQQRLFNGMQQRISRTIPVVVLRPVGESNGVNQARTRLAGSTSEETSWAAGAIHRAARLALHRRAPFESPHPPKNPCQPSVTNLTP